MHYLLSADMARGRATSLCWGHVGTGLECTKCGSAIDRNGVDEDKSQSWRVKKPTNKAILVELVSDWSSGPFWNDQVSP